MPSPCCCAACWPAACWRNAASTRMSRRWRRRWSGTASRPAAGRWPRSSAARPKISTRPRSVARRSRAWPRISPTASWRRCSGWSFAGLPGALAYKAINTADSMIGHKSPRHLAFGWASARCDDLVNLPASRLSVLWLVAGGRAARPVAGGARWPRCGAMRAITARPMPAGRKPRWPARSASGSPVRASMTAWRSRSAGWARATASLSRATFATR